MDYFRQGHLPLGKGTGGGSHQANYLASAKKEIPGYDLKFYSWESLKLQLG